MPELDDQQLLRDFVGSRSEAAFDTLVTRYVNLVYSAALRFGADPQLAEEITQAAFIILARKAGDLRRGTVLSGWLYQTARLTAANVRKSEIRRQRREQEACMQSILNEPDAAAWEEIAPLLDDAMGRLGETDRNAIVLRFFENKTAREVAATLKLTEAAAHKRVNRALDKLRGFFAKRGITSTSSAIAGAISAHSVHTAPVGLAKTISAVALAKGAVASTSALTLIKGALNIMAWTKAKTAIVAGVGVLLAAGTATITVREVEHHREASIWDGITGPDFMQQLKSLPPVVSIRPTRFAREMAGSYEMRGKILGVYQPFNSLLARAYDISPSRILALTPLPEGDFDYITTVSEHQTEALQQTLKQQFGIVGRRERREADVLLLTLKRPGAPGLKPTSSTDRDSPLSTGTGRWKRLNGSIHFLTYDLEC